ncbi:MAG: phosphonate metabolism protein/1,5-bisphosphokinase (PRPP-forming) PhnN [Pseudomonadota bacterium]
MDRARVALADDPRFVFARRVITRAADAGGEAHEAVSEAEFDARLASFALHWSAHGLRYAIPGSIEAEMEAGRVVIANLSRGVLADAARYRLRVLLITAPIEVRAARLAARGREDAQDVAARLSREAPLPEGLDVVTVMNDATPDEGAARVLAALNRAAEDARR